DTLTQENQRLLFTPVTLQNIYYQFEKRFDRENGGFGGAPKFPGSMSHEFLLQYYHHLHEPEALEQVEFSLERMIQGGIYDQLGGGFARYATDAEWLVPHFEKMLYDNALLVSLLSDVYRITKKEIYRETIEETLEFIHREMTSPEGGFYSALDADSEGVEGKYYVWDKSEIDIILKEDAILFNDFYDVTEEGNWEETNILWRAQSYEEYAAAEGLDVTILKNQLKARRATLFAARQQRVRPGLDDKILLDWNALMCTAHAKAYKALGNVDYKNTAERNLQFLLEKLQQPDGVSYYHTYKEGKAQYDAFLDDYANLIEAIIYVYSINFDLKLLDRAKALTDFVIQHFHDTESGLFFFTSENQQDILLRRKELYDNATPSGNSTMIHNLLKLAILLDRPDYKVIAVNMLKAMRDAVERYPSSFARWATAMVPLVFSPPEIAIVGEDAFTLAAELNQLYIPNKVMMAAPQAQQDYPLLADRNASSETNIYICRDYACQLPVKTVEEAKKMLDIGS
ncbi:MAG: thioredoxin domain-containing protein, partial [Saprospiraceae bacterium]